MKREVLEADKIKGLRDGEPSPVAGVSKSGDSPRSIRKRGFWRAYKRRELWAVMSHMTRQLCEDMYKDIFEPNAFAKILVDNNAPNKIIYITYPITGLSNWLKDEK